MNNLLDIISKLPDELARQILEYIPKIYLALLNKFFYNKYSYYIVNSITNYDSFIRHIIQNDYSYIFEKHVFINNYYWLNKEKYYYNNKIYANYGYFIMVFCIENNADKCKNLLTLYWAKKGLCQNRHKKNICKHIRWKK